MYTRKVKIKLKFLYLGSGRVSCIMLMSMALRTGLRIAWFALHTKKASQYKTQEVERCLT